MLQGKRKGDAAEDGHASSLGGAGFETGDVEVNVLRVAVAIAGSALLVAACSASSSTVGEPAEAGACGSLPPPKDGSRRRVDDLPSGECSSRESCSVGVYRSCPCSEIGPYDVYLCECDGARWSCTLTSKAASLCYPCADADAAPDTGDAD